MSIILRNKRPPFWTDSLPRIFPVGSGKASMSEGQMWTTWTAISPAPHLDSRGFEVRKNLFDVQMQFWINNLQFCQSMYSNVLSLVLTFVVNPLHCSELQSI